MRDPRIRFRGHGLAGVVLLCSLTAACSEAPRLIAEDPQSGFALYRSGRLSRGEIREICRLGVEEILVLDGEAEARECSFRREECPALAVRYNLASCSW